MPSSRSVPAASAPQADTPTFTEVLNLAGAWDFELDPSDTALSGGDVTRPLSDTITLPGTTDSAGKGKPADPEHNQLGRLARGHSYVGPAWYARDVDLPAAWAGRPLRLFLERAHWVTTAWIDGVELGTRESLSAPHSYDLPASLSPGRHRIVLRVDNRMRHQIGNWSHSITDETMGNWNGVIGRLEIQALPLVRLEAVRVGCDVHLGLVWLDGEIVAATPTPPADVRLRATLLPRAGSRASISTTETVFPPRRSNPGSNTTAATRFRIELPLDSRLEHWDEFTPVLHAVHLDLLDSETRPLDHVAFPLGVRCLETRDQQFFLNGRPMLFRGNLTGGEFPETGHQPTDEASWERVIRIMKDHGLNGLRFHSFCPPEAAFAAADRLGFYFLPEGPFWTYVDRLTPEFAFMREEAHAMLRAYGNHPSFIGMGFGNEIHGDDDAFSALINECRDLDPRRLYTFDANHPRYAKRQTPLYNVDYFVTRHTWHGPIRLASDNRFTTRFPCDGPDLDYTAIVRHIGVPVVAHELGQWASYPNFDEIERHQGVMRPYNLAFFKRLLEFRGLAHQARAFTEASGRLALQLYKEDVEACRRTARFGGYQLLQLQDFPGQGDALVGLLDAHWTPKTSIRPDEVAAFCGPTITLATFARFVWTRGETFTARLLVSHFGPTDFERASVAWRIVPADGGEPLAQGSFDHRALRAGALTSVGEINVSLPHSDRAERFDLVVDLAGTAVSNRWPVWVYPAAPVRPEPSAVRLVDAFDDATRAHLAAGGVALLSLRRDADLASHERIVRTQFKTVFWTSLWRTSRHAITHGILCDPAHPALRDFPTDAFSNWQWSELLNDGHAFQLNGTGHECRPIVQAIDDFHRAYKLGHIVETRVGPGRLLLCGFDLHNDLDRRPVARQLRASLLAYVAGPDFRPACELPVERLLAPGLPRELRVLHATSALDPDPVAQSTIMTETDHFAAPKPAFTPGEGAARAFDLDWNTSWHIDGTRFPQEVSLDLGARRTVRELLIRPARGAKGKPEAVEVYLSDDLSNWGAPVVTCAQLHVFQHHLLLPAPTTARYLRLVFTRGTPRQNALILAEIEIVNDL